MREFDDEEEELEGTEEEAGVEEDGVVDEACCAVCALATAFGNGTTKLPFANINGC